MSAQKYWSWVCDCCGQTVRCEARDWMKYPQLNLSICVDCAESFIESDRVSEVGPVIELEHPLFV